jgi:hypothetical protein
VPSRRGRARREAGGVVGAEDTVRETFPVLVRP